MEPAKGRKPSGGGVGSLREVATVIVLFPLLFESPPSKHARDTSVFLHRLSNASSSLSTTAEPITTPTPCFSNSTTVVAGGRRRTVVAKQWGSLKSYPKISNGARLEW
ncbi:hypothetical protein RIF29_32487 [Crotalaria pallida]|uniref:Uncharacterized protein n=1 Tax=Crotalaria pallida TaxID=3830 RepID=A0AAN9HZE9_CROPI